nr:antitoxin VbhA family protein [uncultured Acetatifactor sp.]
MAENRKWQCELGEYIKQGEPDRAEKSAAWQTAIGLQAVDNLQISEYLLETAKAHIEGKIDIGTAQERIQSYYAERKDRKEIEDTTREADIVSLRITEILGEQAFRFSPAEWQTNCVYSGHSGVSGISQAGDWLPDAPGSAGTLPGCASDSSGNGQYGEERGIL